MDTPEGNKTVHVVGQSQESSGLPEEFLASMNLVRCHNVDELVGQLSSQHSPFELLMSGVFTSAISLLGTLGNLKSVTLLRNPQVFTGGQFLTETLTALAVWDSILLLSVVGYYSVGTIWKYLFDSVPNALLYATMIFHPLNAASYTATAMLAAALTIQRMFIVGRPLGPRRLSVRKKSCFTVMPGVVYVPCFLD